MPQALRGHGTGVVTTATYYDHCRVNLSLLHVALANPHHDDIFISSLFFFFLILNEKTEVEKK